MLTPPCLGAVYSYDAVGSAAATTGMSASYGYSSSYMPSSAHMAASSYAASFRAPVRTTIRQVVKGKQRFITRSGQVIFSFLTPNWHRFSHGYGLVLLFPQEIEFIEGVRNVPLGIVRPA